MNARPVRPHGKSRDLGYYSEVMASPPPQAPVVAPIPVLQTSLPCKEFSEFKVTVLCILEILGVDRFGDLWAVSWCILACGVSRSAGGSAANESN